MRLFLVLGVTMAARAVYADIIKYDPTKPSEASWTSQSCTLDQLTSFDKMPPILITAPTSSFGSDSILDPFKKKYEFKMDDLYICGSPTLDLWNQSPILSSLLNPGANPSLFAPMRPLYLDISAGNPVTMSQLLREACTYNIISGCGDNPSLWYSNYINGYVRTVPPQEGAGGKKDKDKPQDKGIDKKGEAALTAIGQGFEIKDDAGAIPAGGVQAGLAVKEAGSGGVQTGTISKDSDQIPPDPTAVKAEEQPKKAKSSGAWGWPQRALDVFGVFNPANAVIGSGCGGPGDLGKQEAAADKEALGKADADSRKRTALQAQIDAAVKPIQARCQAAYDRISNDMDLTAAEKATAREAEHKKCEEDIQAKSDAIIAANPNVKSSDESAADVQQQQAATKQKTRESLGEEIQDGVAALRVEYTTANNARRQALLKAAGLNPKASGNKDINAYFDEFWGKDNKNLNAYVDAFIAKRSKAGGYPARSLDNIEKGVGTLQADAAGYLKEKQNGKSTMGPEQLPAVPSAPKVDDALKNRKPAAAAKGGN